MDDLLQLVTTAGGPLGVALVLLHFSRRIAVWVEPRASKLIDAHLDFVSSVKSELIRQSQQIDAIHKQVVK